MPDLPIFLIAGCPKPFNPDQPESIYTTDAGNALIENPKSQRIAFLNTR